jgi:hypothetical protein
VLHSAALVCKSPLNADCRDALVASSSLNCADPSRHRRCVPPRAVSRNGGRVTRLADHAPSPRFAAVTVRAVNVSSLPPASASARPSAPRTGARSGPRCRGCQSHFVSAASSVGCAGRCPHRSIATLRAAVGVFVSTPTTLASGERCARPMRAWHCESALLPCALEAQCPLPCPASALAQAPDPARPEQAPPALRSGTRAHLRVDWDLTRQSPGQIPINSVRQGAGPPAPPARDGAPGGRRPRRLNADEPHSRSDSGPC